MGKPVAYKKQNSVLEIFITESRLPFAQISSIYRKQNKQKNKQTNTHTHKTKQGSTLNIPTELGSESASTSHAYWVKPIILGVLSDWL